MSTGSLQQKVAKNGIWVLPPIVIIDLVRRKGEKKKGSNQMLGIWRMSDIRHLSTVPWMKFAFRVGGQLELRAGPSPNIDVRRSKLVLDNFDYLDTQTSLVFRQVT